MRCGVVGGVRHDQVPHHLGSVNGSGSGPPSSPDISPVCQRYPSMMDQMIFTCLSKYVICQWCCTCQASWGMYSWPSLSLLTTWVSQSVYFTHDWHWSQGVEYARATTKTKKSSTTECAFMYSEIAPHQPQQQMDWGNVLSRVATVTRSEIMSSKTSTLMMDWHPFLQYLRGPAFWNRPNMLRWQTGNCAFTK